MTTQHTPGPWAIRKHEKGFVVYYTDGEIRSNTAQCYDRSVAEEHGTAEANAQLIAAAPELLAALQNIADHLWLEAKGEGKMDTKDLLQKAEAAIAKATTNS